MSHLFLTDISKEHGVDEGGLAKPGLAGQHQVEAETPFHCSSVHLQPGIQFELGASSFLICSPDMAAYWSRHSHWVWALLYAVGSFVSASQGLEGPSDCSLVSPVCMHIKTVTITIIMTTTMIVTGFGGGGGAGSVLLSSVCTADKLSCSSWSF